MGIAADFVLIVVAGLLGGLLARLVRLPLLVGYVVAGVVVGPYTGGPTVVQIHDIELLAEIGVALLLFSLGLEISLSDLRPVRKIALIGGPIQIALTAAAAAWAGVLYLRLPVGEAIWFGSMISLSSTMVVLKTLSSAGATTTLASRVMIGLLVVQDLAVIPMLIVLPQLRSLENILPRLLSSIGEAAAVLAAIVVAGKWLLPRLLKRVLRWGTHELFLVSVVAVGVGVGYAAQAAGISFALGAFAAGIVLSESEFSHQALSDVVPLRDIFGLLFFVTVGMLFDPGYVLAHVQQVTLVVLLIVLGKSVLIGTLARTFGYTNMAPWIIGLGLSQIGEFSFVLARSGRSLQLLSQETYDLALTSAILTMALSPMVSRLALPLGRSWREWRKPGFTIQTAHLANEGLRDHVVVAGYGRSGQTVAQALHVAGTPLIVVELDHLLFGAAQSKGIPAIWGDVAREEVLRAAHVDRAQMLVLAIPDRGSIKLTLQRVRSINPKIAVIARALRNHHVKELRSMGVDIPVQPEFEGGIEMLRQVLIRRGCDDAETSRLVAHMRENLYGAV